MKIAVAGLGYVGLSNAVLLSRKYEVVATDISTDRVAMITARKSPIIDADIERFLAEEILNLTATTDAAAAFADADFVIVATPTNYDTATNHFDTSSVEAVIEAVSAVNAAATIVVKSTIPVGFIERIRAETGRDNVIFSPEFLREGRALHDNLHPSRIVVGEDSDRARVFAGLLADCALETDIPTSTATPWPRALKAARSLMGCLSIRGSGTIITTRLLAMADIACPKIPNSWDRTISATVPSKAS